MHVMTLTVSSLGDVVVARDDVVALRAEDASGCFGIRTGHADLLTALDVGVVSWRYSDGSEHHCAVRRGVLHVHDGRRIDIVTREAIVDDNLDRLESTVLNEFRSREEGERSMRTESHRLELQALREIMRYLNPERGDMRRPR
jgi:F-type H+-transporting ATPase subunit epsilon